MDRLEDYSPLDNLATILSEQKASNDMQAAYPDDPVDLHNAMKSELSQKAFELFQRESEFFNGINSPLVLAGRQLAKEYKKTVEEAVGKYPTVAQQELKKARPGWGEVYNSQSTETREKLDKLYINLLDEEILSNNGVVVESPEEAAKVFGRNLEDVTEAYGLLSSLEEVLNEDDTISFMAISFEEAKQIPRISADDDTDESNRGSDGSEAAYVLSEDYMARVRKDAEGKILSLVLDSVPPKESNAAYVLRGDDGRIKEVDITTKKDLREAGARRVYHTKTGQEGTVKRINRLLAMSFEDFNNLK